MTSFFFDPLSVSFSRVPTILGFFPKHLPPAAVAEGMAGESTPSRSTEASTVSERRALDLMRRFPLSSEPASRAIVG